MLPWSHSHYSTSLSLWLLLYCFCLPTNNFFCFSTRTMDWNQCYCILCCMTDPSLPSWQFPSLLSIQWMVIHCSYPLLLRIFPLKSFSPLTQYNHGKIFNWCALWRNIIWYKHSRVQAKFKNEFIKLILLWCLCILGLQCPASGKRFVFEDRLSFLICSPLYRRRKVRWIEIEQSKKLLWN